MQTSSRNAIHAQLSQSRRDFLRRLAAGSFAGLMAEPLGFPKTRTQLNVIIVGAGMAGLCAAYELEKLGHIVTILEAEQTHVGGRVRTMHFADGEYGELGAMRIPGNHHLTRRYISTLGLQLRSFVQYNPNAYYYANGIRKRIREVEHMSREFTLGMDGRAASEWSQPFDEIVGGMDTMAAAFAARLKSKPRMGCAVTRITQDYAKKSVTAAYRDRSTGRSNEKLIAGDVLLCTLPLPVLRHIQIEPALSAAKQRAMAELPYNAANKVLADVQRRFWEMDDRIFGGGTYTDLPTEFTYYPSDNAKAKDPRVSAGPGVLLASYTIGKAALRYAAMSSAAAAESAVGALAGVHPQLLKAGMVHKSLSWSWDNHPWSLGGFAAPHKRMDLNSLLAAPVGRIFFAGEHLSQHRTWIQGALESALVAVKQIVAAET
jgi:monoamine oxidase